jgi:ParB family chromosome partitioning protein
LSSQPKLLSTTRRFGNTAKLCGSLRFTTSTVSDEAAQLALFGEIKEKALSVREAELRAAELASRPDGKPDDKSVGVSDGEKLSQTPNPEPALAKQATPLIPRDPHVADMEQKFIDTLGTTVKIDGSVDKGVIRIEYYNMEDLDRIYEAVTAN